MCYRCCQQLCFIWLQALLWCRSCHCAKGMSEFSLSLSLTTSISMAIRCGLNCLFSYIRNSFSNKKINFLYKKIAWFSYVINRLYMYKKINFIFLHKKFKKKNSNYFLKWKSAPSVKISRDIYLIVEICGSDFRYRILFVSPIQKVPGFMTIPKRSPYIIFTPPPPPRCTCDVISSSVNFNNNNILYEVGNVKL